MPLGNYSNQGGLASGGPLRRRAMAQAQRQMMFDSQQAQQNSAGRLSAARQSSFRMPTVPGSQMASKMGGGSYAMTPPPLQQGMGGSPLDARVAAALNGNPMARIPLDQQGFAASQLRQPAPMMGQAMASIPPGGPAPVPMMGSQQSSGLQPGNPWYNNAPQPRPAGNGFGLARTPAGAVVSDTEARGMTNGTLANYGESRLKRVDGKNVLMGNRGDINIPEVGGTRAAVRAGQEKFMASPEGQAQVSRLRQRFEREDQQKGLLRQAAQNRRLAQMGSPGLGQGNRSEVTSLQSQGPIPVDTAVNHLNRNSATDIWAMNGISNLPEADPAKIAGSLDTETYRKMSPNAQQAVQRDVENYIAANPDMDDITKDELRRSARGDKTVRRESEMKRRKAGSEPFQGNYFNPPVMPRIPGGPV